MDEHIRNVGMVNKKTDAKETQKFTFEEFFKNFLDLFINTR